MCASGESNLDSSCAFTMARNAGNSDFRGIKRKGRSYDVSRCVSGGAWRGDRRTGPSDRYITGRGHLSKWAFLWKRIRRLIFESHKTFYIFLAS